MSLLLPWLVPLVGMPNKDASKNREGDGSSALGGCRLVLRRNYQLIVGGSDRRDDGEDAQPGWSIWGGVFLLFWGSKLNDKKNTKIKYDKGLRWPPFDILSRNNQPETRRREGGRMG